MRDLCGLNLIDRYRYVEGGDDKLALTLNQINLTRMGDGGICVAIIKKPLLRQQWFFSVSW